MLSVCPECARLWAEYDGVLKRYAAAVGLMDGKSGDLDKQAEAAQVKTYECREKIKRHCMEHVCDPLWLKE